MKPFRLESDETAAWIALTLAPGVGRATVIRLIDLFGSASAAWKAGKSALDNVKGISPLAKTSLLAGPDMTAVARIVHRLSEIDGWIMRFTDDDYPELLAGTADCPALLYGTGSRQTLSSPCVAIVGSRSASSYGIRAAGLFASGLASRGLCVVSGLALGIDSAAHRASIEAGGVTVAVTGCGLDVIYPRRNEQLAVKIRENGAVISEYAPGTQPEAHNFPVRNRIISGLSQAVVVVEASRRSGSLITASLALEQGREVMAVPGSIYSYKSYGTHWLLKQGAAPVTEVEDILEAVNWHDGAGHAAGDRGHGRRRLNFHDVQVPEGLDHQEEILWKGLDDYPRHIDELAALCGLSAADVGGLLIQMELKGLVQAMPGQMYQRVI